VFSLAALESKLVEYVNDKSALALPFDISSIPKVSRAQAQQEAARTCQSCEIAANTISPSSASSSSSRSHGFGDDRCVYDAQGLDIGCTPAAHDSGDSIDLCLTTCECA